MASKAYIPIAMAMRWFQLVRAGHAKGESRPGAWVGGGGIPKWCQNGTWLAYWPVLMF